MPIAPGTRVGPYEILDSLGAGGMGEVYKATDTRLGRTVAIKFLHAAHSERFQREARAIAALNHPHICTLHDVGPDYLVMEYVEGSPLSGPLKPEEVLRLALQIAQALEAAHRKGIIHRDLKPGNILVTDAGVKLLDFGLAKLQQEGCAAEDTVTQTQAGTILGTAAYMSPEQAEGKPADARSDVFSFGLVLYEMVSGRRAFSGQTSVSTMAAILHKEPEPLDGPAEIESIIKGCLRKAPAERYQTMAEVKAMLEAVKLRPAEKTPSIAVLPFANMSGDKENEYFSDGLAEEIINALTKLPGLKVAARTSAFAFKGKNEDIRRIGDALGVAHVLEGSVRKAGNRLRVTAQLIAIADGCHVWSERYDREMADVFAIQDEISQSIVEVLKVKLGRPAGQALAPRRTLNLAAYHAFLEGNYHKTQLTEAGLARGREYYERAIALDAEYAPPYAGLAECYLYLALYAAVPAREVVPKALASAERAMVLDPGAAEGYLARGVIKGACELDWPAANRDFERAAQLNPDSPFAHYRRGWWYLIPVGRLEEAVVELHRAAELDPLSVLTRGLEAMALSIAGHRETAIERARSAMALFPDSFLSAFLLGSALGGCGLFEEEAAIMQRGLQAAPGNIWLLAALAVAYAHQGKTAEISRIALQLEEMSSRRRVSQLALGMVQAALGNTEATCRLLEGALEEREIWTVSFLRQPYCAAILPDSLCESLLRKMNLR